MKIICIGRNYAAHAKELKNDVPTEPVIFIKPDTAYLKSGNTFLIPDFSNDIHYECELVVKISKPGKNISKEFAHRYYNEIGLGIDFTARDIQSKCKEKGLPWERAKAFDNSAVVGDFINISKKDWVNEVFRLEKNGQKVQESHAGNMLFDIDFLISNISEFITLKTGDLIFTGTPEGVGRVEPGDELNGFWFGEKLLSLKIG